jgi:hypothetical protein
MKPGVVFCSERYNDVIRSVRLAALRALTRDYCFRIAVQPLDNAAFISLAFGFGP